DATAPPELWERIAQTIAQEPRDELAVRRARRRPNWSTALVAVAAAVAVVLGIVAVSERQTTATTLNRAVMRATRPPRARALWFPPNGTTVAKAVVLPDGSGFLKNEAMSALPSTKTYQLWAATGDPQHPTLISAGVIGADPRTIGFHVNGDVHGLAISVEN